VEIKRHPCLTPDTVSKGGDICPSWSTRQLNILYPSLITLTIFTGNPISLNAIQIHSRSTESKAFSQSIKVRYSGDCHSTACSIIILKELIWSTQERSKILRLVKEPYEVCEISGSYGVEYEDESLLGYSAVWSRWSRPTFQRCELPPSLGLSQRDYTELYLIFPRSTKEILRMAKFIISFASYSCIATRLLCGEALPDSSGGIS
jgi:hypothetical protein